MNLNVVTLELMLLGFISLLLTVSEKPIASICIPESLGETFLPCTEPSNGSKEEAKCEAQVCNSFNHIPHFICFWS